MAKAAAKGQKHGSAVKVAAKQLRAHSTATAEKPKAATGKVGKAEQGKLAKIGIAARDAALAKGASPADAAKAAADAMDRAQGIPAKAAAAEPLAKQPASNTNLSELKKQVADAEEAYEKALDEMEDKLEKWIRLVVLLEQFQAKAGAAPEKGKGTIEF